MNLDLAQKPAGHDVKLSIEREETAGDRWVRLFKEVVLFVFAIVLAGVVLVYCFESLRDTATSADSKRWAQSVLSAAVGGLLGFLLKR